MSLMKWFRKKNKKILAIVVIFILFGFLGGGTLLKSLQSKSIGLNKTVAYYLDNKKITGKDLMLARQELEILRLLGTDQVLRSQDLQTVLLAELLFPTQQASPMTNERLKRAIRTSGYRISNRQVNDIYSPSAPQYVYWLLLKNEARRAGVRVPGKAAGNILTKVIPQLAGGATYSRVIAQLMNNYRISEEKILTTFADLLSVLEYAKAICLSEDVTSSQIKYTASLKQQTFDVEFVKFDSADFVDDQNEPNQQQLIAHFEKYSKFLPGDVSDENPYGFGYKLPDRVRLEYIAVKLDDVSEIVPHPTQEDAEEYYQRHSEQFAMQLPSDPNDPNSPPIKKTKSYAEVSGVILKYLLQNKIDSKAERIIQQARTITETDPEDACNIEPGDEHFAKKAVSYRDTAEKLSKEHNITVYTGQTGLLGAADIQSDDLTGQLRLKNYTTSLPQIVFSVDPLALTKPGPFDAPKPAMFENIGPLRDLSGQIMAMVRVIEAQKSREPESLDYSFMTHTFLFDPNTPDAAVAQRSEKEDVFSVKEKVIKDLKKLAALQVTESKAHDFIKQVVKDGWDGAIDKFNEVYGPQDQNEPNAFKLESLTGLQRISKATMQIITAQLDDNPAATLIKNGAEIERRFINKLYSLVPDDANSLETVPVVVEFKPNVSFYVIKNISVKRLQQNDYQQIKSTQAYQEETSQSQNLAVVHLNPDNILKRMRFREIEQDKDEEDANTPSQESGRI